MTHLDSFNDDCASNGQPSSVLIKIKLTVSEPQTSLNCLEKAIKIICTMLDTSSPLACINACTYV